MKSLCLLLFPGRSDVATGVNKCGSDFVRYSSAAEIGPFKAGEGKLNLLPHSAELSFL
jgi:hypothetical protein